MKFIIQLVATIIVCFLLQTFLPWWSMAIGAFAVAYLVGNKSLISFFAGLLGVGILWLTVAMLIDYDTHSILTDKINKLLPLNALLLTTLVGGVVGGLSSLTGALIRAKK
jgi:hypothetical protein